ncbi:FtsW/RodA/SpoVE family cell cycle protein, partial [candidate division WWE3 bacterium]|nr:FtsW/RodA/SpoVE family cell cycle protein [candidate division WWE3 bacterium]
KGGASESLGYHINQIQIALGSGGIWGVGLGQSRQKHQYLPEVSADSIFAVIGEEMGFIGTVLVILLFVLFMYKGYKIALEQSDVFLQTLAVGLTTWVVIHFLVNIGAVVGLIPLTGVPLPFISYGGSSVIFILMGMGLLANISMEDSQKRKFKQRR